MRHGSLNEQPSFDFPGGFEPDPTAKRIPIPGEKGYLEPGFHWDDQGRIVDDEGSIYNEWYQLMEKAAPLRKKMEVEEEEAEMKRLAVAHPEWRGNENRLRANAKIILSKKPGDSYRSKPHNPHPN